MRWIRSAAALALVACATPVGAPPRNTTSGLALGAGVGYQAPVIGGVVLYHHDLGSRWWLVPYVGGGAWPVEDVVRPGLAAGTMLAWGLAHRLAFDLSVGLTAIEYRKSPVLDEVVDTRDLYGATAAAGYQFVAAGGFFVHALGGVSALFAEPGSNQSRWSPTLDITLGYKIW